MKSHVWKLAILSSLGIFLLTAGFGCKGTSPAVQQASQPIVLEYWRVADAQDAFSDIIAAYQQLRPMVTIRYKKLRAEEYERAILDAWAEGRGPDIFSIPNTWVGKYESKIYPLPAVLNVPKIIEVGTIKKEQKTIIQKETALTAAQVKNLFVDQVADDVVRNNKVLGLPLALDALVLYANRDLMNVKGIAEAPRTWNDFRDAVIRLSQYNQANDIVQAGAAIGTANNINRAQDILAALMMQSGATMEDAARSAPRFQQPATRERNPAVEALRFYTDFANPAKETYAWNEKQEDGFRAFITGKAAFYIGYAYHLPLILAQAPGLNLEIAPLPQLAPESPVNFARYWVETVFNNPKRDPQKLTMAWDFLQFATKADQAKTYVKRSRKPTALRALIKEQQQDIDMGVFAREVLTAKSWYHGKNADATDAAFAEMISRGVAGTMPYVDIVNAAAARVGQTY